MKLNTSQRRPLGADGLPKPFGRIQVALLRIRPLGAAVRPSGPRVQQGLSTSQRRSLGADGLPKPLGRTQVALLRVRPLSGLQCDQADLELNRK